MRESRGLKAENNRYRKENREFKKKITELEKRFDEDRVRFHQNEERLTREKLELENKMASQQCYHRIYMFFQNPQMKTSTRFLRFFSKSYTACCTGAHKSNKLIWRTCSSCAPIISLFQ